MRRRTFLQLLLAAPVLPGRGAARSQDSGPSQSVRFDRATATWHVHPGGRIQDALEAAAKDPVNKTVYVHGGTYRPPARGQALIWFNARHDGITLEAAGDVVLTAANPEVADAKAPSFPAVVNHVVYFGDGVSRKTVLRGFKVTGARNFTTGTGDKSPIESDDIRKTPFFYADGGGIKVYARSYPTIEHVEVYDNYTSPCGGGVSVEHLGQVQDSALFRHCIFRDNRTQITGSAVDLLHGSRATIENCLFVENLANMGVDYVGMLGGAEYRAEHGSGALTVFEGSRATVSRCTFTNNWNGVDDNGAGSTYVDSIFWQNTLGGGISPGSRYELDVMDGSGVSGSFIHGAVNDLRGTISKETNIFDPPDPRFDERFVPRAPEYAKAGYRPVGLPFAERRTR
ncbi:MAG TPA: right-handed parallel beta-helix repeat-containing protein [Vicinamibacterales bacterium]|nr:right-handed parallel beta-helix repeat-containing protein [Vicinamibacterales bacterium]